MALSADVVYKVSEGRPHIVDYIKNGDIQMVINTSVGRKSSRDAYHIRRGALDLQYSLHDDHLAGARALSEATNSHDQQKTGRFAPCRSIIANRKRNYDMLDRKRCTFET
ncbi:MAG: hypothetical protein MZU91_09600 [Desulfosudis oleivorans]|nr:hypothetical protein [Desulfosudis oleivorans]